jgi:hypothetical protein
VNGGDASDEFFDLTPYRCVWRAAPSPFAQLIQKYYNEARTHLSLHKDAPIPRAVQTVGDTLAVSILGGLHHQYIRV